jgi:23S rRNA (cytidine1920-2'-O)/16S rRNA (cytidine1409-2'-O)-methyltransferase
VDTLDKQTHFRNATITTYATMTAIKHRSPKLRLDRLLVERGLAASRERSQSLILAGRVLVNDKKVEKCGAAVWAGAEVRITGEFPKYVSRAGLKLEGALEVFKIDPAGCVCMDVGSSTGGFTDCLLQKGARKVFAVDVGTNQLHCRLRNDPRVKLLERTNARYLRFEAIGERIGLVTMDVSFISATLIIPVLPQFLSSGSKVLVLVKPQFEVGREEVGEGGVVREPQLQHDAVRKVTHALIDLGFDSPAVSESILPGARGNREFFVCAAWLRCAFRSP